MWSNFIKSSSSTLIFLNSSKPFWHQWNQRMKILNQILNCFIFVLNRRHLLWLVIASCCYLILMIQTSFYLFFFVRCSLLRWINLYLSTLFIHFIYMTDSESQKNKWKFRYDFCLVSWFDSISNGLFNAKDILEENQQWYYLSWAGYVGSYLSLGH